MPIQNSNVKVSAHCVKKGNFHFSNVLKDDLFGEIMFGYNPDRESETEKVRDRQTDRVNYHDCLEIKCLYYYFSISITMSPDRGSQIPRKCSLLADLTLILINEPRPTSFHK